MVGTVTGFAMKKYNVTLYYHTHIVVEVEADNEEEAIEAAYNAAENEDFQLLENLIGEGDPDVEEI